MINFPRNGHILLGLKNLQNLFTQVKRDKNIKFFVQFSEDEKLRSFTAEKQSNKTSNHVKYLRVYVHSYMLLHTNYIIVYVNLYL